MSRCGALLFVALAAGVLPACSRSADPPPPHELHVSHGELANVADPPLLVFVGEDGVARLDGIEIGDDATILTRARDYQAAHPHGVAMVRCAPSTIHGRATRIVELLEEAQIQSVAIDQLR
ncbi:MAG TPA: hypothetical protein VF407_19635 [Polyangiaceae bacterium]